MSCLAHLLNLVCLRDLLRFVCTLQIKPPSSPEGRFTQILSVGIGGSALGPQFVAEALAPDNPPLKVSQTVLIPVNIAFPCCLHSWQLAPLLTNGCFFYLCLLEGSPVLDFSDPNLLCTVLRAFMAVDR